MIDPAFVRIKLHGHIENAETMEAIITVLVTKGYYGALGSEPLDGPASCRREFLRAILSGDAPEFTNDECHLADTDDIENAMRRHLVSFLVKASSGMEYAAACRSWSPVHDYFEYECAYDGVPVVSMPRLQGALASNVDISKWVVAEIDAMEKASGLHLPEFTVGPGIKRVFADSIAKAALGV